MIPLNLICYRLIGFGKRENEWILKNDKDEYKRGKDAYEIIREKLGNDWEDKVETVVTLKTMRIYPNKSESHWVDFTSWARWKIGYYAVESYVVKSGKVDISRGNQDTIPNKGIACLFHIFGTQLYSKKQQHREELLSFARKSAPYITDTPLYGPEIDHYSSEEEFESDEED